MTDKAFAAGMRQRRLQNDWSLQDLAKFVDVTKQHLSYVERGERRASAKLKERICKALTVDADALQQLGREHLAKENDGESI